MRKQQSQFRQQSRQAALCGLLAALSVVVLTLGSILPLATFACPMLAMVCLLPVLVSFGAGPALLVYAAVSVLAVLLCADKELACFYVFLGWYPVLRPRLAGLPRVPRIAVKCGLFSLSVSAMYALLVLLFRLEAVMAEFAESSSWMLILLLALLNATLLLFDRALETLTALLQRKRRR